MLRSMYSGISGMKNFQMKLDVIGNNIANVNTYGYKKSRTTFKDLISQQISGAGAATQTRGGTNAQQIGLGTQLSTIDTIHTTGATQTTARTLDLALAGDGFFPVAAISDVSRVSVDRGNQLGNNVITGAIDRAMDVNYTRAGNFYLDDRGYLVTSDGMFLIGDTGEKTLPTAANVTKANEALSEISAFETSYKKMKDAEKSLEQKANLLLKAYQDYDDAYTTWSSNNSPTGNDPSYVALQNTYTNLQNIYNDFHNNSVNSAAGHNTSLTNFNNALGNSSSGLNEQFVAFNLQQVSTGITSLAQSTDYPAQPSNSGYPALSGEIEAMKTLIDKISNFKIDLDKVAQSVITLESAAEDLLEPTWTDSLSGQPGLIQVPLNAKSFSIGPDGSVTFVNDKGQLNIAGQIRIANFANPGGLEKVGGNLFRQSANSGTVDQNNNGIQLNELLIPGEEGAGSIVSGSLEMSNVDLSEEFTEMIVAQRGFQSNTKIITTSDEILQELVNLKR